MANSGAGPSLAVDRLVDVPTAGRRPWVQAALPPYPVAVGALLAGVGFTLGVLQTRSLVLGALGAIGGALFPKLVLDPFLAVWFLVFVEVSQTGDALAYLGMPSPYLLTHATAVLAVLVGLRFRTVRLVWSPVFLFALIFLATRALSILVAEGHAEAVGQVRSQAKDLITLFLVAVLATSSGKIDRVIKAFVISLTLVGGLTVLQEFVFGNSTDFSGLSTVPILSDLGTTTARHGGPIGDANFWARVLVLALPLALSYWAGVRRRASLWFLAAIVLFVAIFLTQSRGALIAVGASLLIWAAISRSGHARYLALAPLVLLLLVVNPVTGPRLATLTAISEPTNELQEVSLRDRVSTNTAALEMFRDNPILGVGPKNYPIRLPAYESTAGFRDARIVDPHNVYLEHAAEGGLVGLTAWVAFLGSILFVQVRALRRLRRGNPRAVTLDQLLAAGLIAGLGGWMVAGAFLHLAQFRTLLVFAGLSIALDARARAKSHEGLPTNGRTAPPPFLAGLPTNGRAVLLPSSNGATSHRAATRWVTAIALGTFAVALAVGLAVAPTRNDRWVARTAAVVRPTAPVDTYLAGYEGDVLTREKILPTFAGVLVSRLAQARAADQLGLDHARRDELSISGTSSNDTAILTVTVRGRHRDDVEAMARELVVTGSEDLESLQRTFVLDPKEVDGPPLVRDRGFRTAIVVRVVMVWATIVGVLIWSVMTWRRRRARLLEARRLRESVPYVGHP